MTLACGRGCSSVCVCIGSTSWKNWWSLHGKFLYLHVNASFMWLVAHVYRLCSNITQEISIHRLFIMHLWWRLPENLQKLNIFSLSYIRTNTVCRLGGGSWNHLGAIIFFSVLQVYSKLHGTLVKFICRLKLSDFVHLSSTDIHGTACETTQLSL